MDYNNAGGNDHKSRPEVRFCSYCGTRLDPGARFCKACGEAVNTGSKAPEEDRRKVYEGELRKCPNCGEILDAFEEKCPACGYELRGVNVSSRVDELAKKLEEVTGKEAKVELIRNFHIPNTKEDIYEFVILATSNINTGDDASEAWLAKLNQAYQKAELVFGKGPELDGIKRAYNTASAACRKQTKGRAVRTVGRAIIRSKGVGIMIVGVIGVLMMIVGWFAGDASGDPDSPFYMMSLIGMGILFGDFAIASDLFGKDK